LDRSAVLLGDELSDRADLSLADAAYTLYAGRKHFEHRRVLAARSRAEAIELLRTPDTKRAFTHAAMEPAGEPVFLFPGGGAQHVGMARVLYEEDREFKATVDEALGSLAPEAASEIRRVWFSDRADSAQAAVSFLRPSLQ